MINPNRLLTAQQQKRLQILDTRIKQGVATPEEITEESHLLKVWMQNMHTHYPAEFKKKYGRYKVDERFLNRRGGLQNVDEVMTLSPLGRKVFFGE